MKYVDRYWKNVIDTLRDGLLIVDPGGTVVAVNPSTEKITGYRADELIGQSCHVLNCTGCQIDGAGKARKWCSLFEVERVRDKKCSITRKDQHATDVIKSATVLHDDEGSVIGAVEYADRYIRYRTQGKGDTLTP